MNIKNISKKIIGIGDVILLPGETKEVPKAYEQSIVLKIYEKNGLAAFEEDSVNQGNDETQDQPDVTNAGQSDENEAAETLRQARLASLKDISDEELGKLANELGINMAECKDQADVLKKVRAALKK